MQRIAPAMAAAYRGHRRPVVADDPQIDDGPDARSQRHSYAQPDGPCKTGNTGQPSRWKGYAFSDRYRRLGCVVRPVLPTPARPNGAGQGAWFQRGGIAVDDAHSAADGRCRLIWLEHGADRAGDDAAASPDLGRRTRQHVPGTRPRPASRTQPSLNPYPVTLATIPRCDPRPVLA